MVYLLIILPPLAVYAHQGQKPYLLFCSQACKSLLTGFRNDLNHCLVARVLTKRPLHTRKLQ